MALSQRLTLREHRGGVDRAGAHQLQQLGMYLRWLQLPIFSVRFLFIAIADGEVRAVCG